MSNSLSFCPIREKIWKLFRQKHFNFLVSIKKRYIFLWKEMESELSEFIGNLNKKRPIIKVEITYSKASITFFNARIFGNQNGIVCTTIYRKPNDRSKFLHYDSAHSKPFKNRIPFGQVLRKFNESVLKHKK